MASPTLSIIVPLYNESGTIEAILTRLLSLAGENEIIVVDDASRDGSYEKARAFGKNIMLLRHQKNQGKGSAIRTGLREATGRYVVIQDADLEYNPDDLMVMLAHIQAGTVPVLFGARKRPPFGETPLYELPYRLGSTLLTHLANLLYGQHLRDEATCYKMFERMFLLSLPLKSRRFEFCPEVIALTSKAGITIPEIPIAYTPRSKQQGKKIRARDWFSAVGTLLYYRLPQTAEETPAPVRVKV